MANDEFNKDMVHGTTSTVSPMNECIKYAKEAQTLLGRRRWDRLAQYAYNAIELVPEGRYPVWSPEALRIDAQVKKEFGDFADVAGEFVMFVQYSKTAHYDARTGSFTA
ncbi:uncharacterized protein NECHADRAFT_77193 [Fusarium vanettenii 77-13-4]|uniref:Uncharacterized protein n=1 Tax=Fusarium vanettenii (strain ATCC MYA-4622 / CBS 123669 / FGSC 9596 / NRRL 45880 / 77-13-4) TaxID=660122 RepID=C7ZJA9_FUSV7|nr:uncharacterized protein NECHADRAFT_77193 [Fusarium vanettenii 77-13-4]EEU35819.1 predicted protein [Fusarium vanettenii 77-13-4]